MTHPSINPKALALAEHAVAQALDLIAQQPEVMVVQAVAGAGKTHLVAAAARQQAALGESVIIGTCTRNQAADVARRIADAGTPVLYTQGSTGPVPAEARHPGITVISKGRDIAPAPGRIVVGNCAKLAHVPTSVNAFDLFICDESYQLRAAEFLPAHTLGRRWLLVGDPAQLDPFTTLADPRMLGSAAVVSAARLVTERRPNAPIVTLPVSRRLSPETMSVVGAAFYPDMEPVALVAPGCRTLRALESGDELLAGIVASEVVGPTIPPEAVRSFVRDVVHCTIVDESGLGAAPSVAVLAAERAQVATLIHALADTDVTVTTFNRAQGQTFDATIVLDPATGSSSAFALDPGRLAVALTRHRIHCTFLAAGSAPSGLEAAGPIPPWHPMHKRPDRAPSHEIVRAAKQATKVILGEGWEPHSQARATRGMSRGTSCAKIEAFSGVVGI